MSLDAWYRRQQVLTAKAVIKNQEKFLERSKPSIQDRIFSFTALGFSLFLMVYGTPMGRTFGAIGLAGWLIFECAPWGRAWGQRLVRGHAQKTLDATRARLAKLEVRQ